MALLWMDGFDHYGSDAAALVGAYLNATPSNVIFSSGTARTGTYALSHTTGNSDGVVNRSLGGAKTVFGIGLGVHLAALPPDYRPLLQFRDAGNTAQCTLWIAADGGIRLTRGSTATSNVLADSASPVIGADNYAHLEMKITMSQTVGQFELRANEVVAINTAANLDTCSSANVESSIVRLILRPVNNPSSGVAILSVDDFFAWDTSGSDTTDFVGDRRVVTLLPSANAATQEWSVTGAANAYTAIQSADDDASYISASDSTPVTSDFDISNPDASVGAITAVQTCVLARKIEAGAATVQSSLLSGGDVTAGTAHSVGDTYAYYHDVFPTDPDTGAPWNNSGLTAAQIRLRRTA